MQGSIPESTRFLSVLTGNERGDIVHRTRTVESIHGDEVLEDGTLQLVQIRGAGRLKLEGSDGLSPAEES